MDITLPEHATRYNALPEVLEASKELLLRNGDSALAVLLSVVRQHGFQDTVGIRLLHKHHEINPGELMVEEASITTDDFALVTRARTFSDGPEGIVPNSWLLDRGRYFPMEYSSLNLVDNPDVTPEMNPTFFADFQEAATRLGVADLVGPALISSGFVESFRPPNSSQMIELTVADERASVLRFVEAPHGEADPNIETFWRSGSNGDHPLAAKTCTRVCQFDPGSTVHKGTFIHRVDG